MQHKRLEILAGPNGAGKSTLADVLLQTKSEFYFTNADVIAAGIGGNSSSSTANQAVLVAKKENGGVKIVEQEIFHTFSQE